MKGDPTKGDPTMLPNGERARDGALVEPWTHTPVSSYRLGALRAAAIKRGVNALLLAEAMRKHPWAAGDSFDGYADQLSCATGIRKASVRDYLKRVGQK